MKADLLCSASSASDPRSADALERAIRDHITLTLARDCDARTLRDVYMSAAWSVRERLAERWAATQRRYRVESAKRVYYLSLEFLMGRTFGNAVLNLGMDADVRDALAQLGYQMEDLKTLEPDAGLGNGGLGRLAACYLDSMATVGIPGYGYGIRYEHGIFKQKIVEGHQVELPDSWLRDENPWEIARPDRTYPVKFFGRVSAKRDAQGRFHFAWVDAQEVLAVAYDTPIPGYQNEVVNTLRLWSAKSTEEFDLSDFLRGDYLGAVESKMQGETISKVLYPPDHTGAGKELRLKQQYFFVSATLQDILRRHKRDHASLDTLPEYVQIQLNDTHPAVAIPEMMRLLMDEEQMEWDQAWALSSQVFAYTNHTVLPEALEVWGEDLFARLLPRHYDLIREIDRRLRLNLVARFPNDAERIERMAILSRGQVRMSNLAIVGSHSVNGVAALHTEILKETLFSDFHALWPDRFVSVTNGVTQRRWLQKANPRLSSLITEVSGDGWIRDLSQLRGIEPSAADGAFREAWRKIKQQNKNDLAALIMKETGVAVNPEAMFDVQVKRIHEYKRQLLNALRLVDLYLRLRDEPTQDRVPRVVLFGGKAAPTYWTAKRIIRLITAVADLVNRDAKISKLLQIVYLPDYRVSMAEKIFPGSDLSEQISTAGYEASGTGNMKFALNGAPTIGTLDGANVEIRQAVGEENFFLFGLTAEEVAERKAAGYEPRRIYEENGRIRRVLDFISAGALTPEDSTGFQGLANSLIHQDPYMLLADFDAYLAAQDEVDQAYRDRERWTRMAIFNVARSGYFSSDRAVREYASRIWDLPI